MDCQRCLREQASWLDEYRDEPLCNACCPPRTDAYAMSFVRVLTRADAQRFSARLEALGVVK
jgi:hypothetical protein